LRHPRRPTAEDDHLIGQVNGFRDRMGHEQHRGAGLLADAQQQIIHFEPGELVERAERLVHQQ
jgi:hypothetical protein